MSVETSYLTLDAVITEIGQQPLLLVTRTVSSFDEIASTRLQGPCKWTNLICDTQILTRVELERIIRTARENASDFVVKKEHPSGATTSGDRTVRAVLECLCSHWHSLGGAITGSCKTQGVLFPIFDESWSRSTMVSHSPQRFSHEPQVVIQGDSTWKQSGFAEFMMIDIQRILPFT